MMSLRLCALVSLCLSRLGLAASVPVVQLGGTTVNGVSYPQLGQEFFGGIPFAEPPLGSLRFAPPILKLTPDVPILNATSFGLSCVQGESFGVQPAPFDNTTQSEDCLTVNVFRPAGLNESSRLPVMVWIYGGGFMVGSANMFNASVIVGQSILRGSPVVYVNFNYRLGPLGYPQGEEATRRGALNLGNKDVLAALTWVQNNIGAFGGDKDKVMIFGESAGAIINGQLLLNTSFDLARAAILSSGSAASFGLRHGPAREDIWQSFVFGVPECTAAGAVNTSHTFECLRSASTEELYNASGLTIMKAQALFPFAPVIDGPGGIIPDLPSKLFAKGEFAKIPSITGTNLDEGPLFLPTTFNSTALLREWIISNSTPSVVPPAELNFVVDELLKLYPNIPALGSPFGTGNETFGLNPEFKRAGALLGDLIFASLRRQWATAASSSGVKVFAYLFTDPQTNTDPLFLGVPHGSDIVYEYGAPQNGPASIALSHNMIDYWVSFATSLTPNDGLGNTSRATWEQFNPASPAVLELNNANLSMIPDTFRKTQFDFMDAHSEALLH